MTLSTFCVTNQLQHVKHKYTVWNTCLMIGKLYMVTKATFLNKRMELYAFLAVIAYRLCNKELHCLYLGNALIKQ